MHDICKYCIFNLRGKLITRFGWLKWQIALSSKTMQKLKKYIRNLLYKRGHVGQFAIPKSWSITGHVNKNYVLKKIKKKKHNERKRPKSGILNIRLLHDNAQHTNPRLIDHFLKKENVYVLHNFLIRPNCLPVTFSA